MIQARGATKKGCKIQKKKELILYLLLLIYISFGILEYEQINYIIN